jgi:hypothetical protein
MKKTVSNAHIDRAARYAAVMGKFGEWLICHWLLRSGFDVAIVDQVGLDVIAYARRSGRRLGHNG